MITSTVFSFLEDLKKNNNRPWFSENKDRYEAARAEMVTFANALLDEMNQYDNLVPMTGKKSLFRIYRDVRFSKDKSPYKTYLAGRMKRATELLRGGMYYHIEPNGSFIGGGFWGPNSKDLKRIRQEFTIDAAPLRKIIADPVFIKYFGELQGDEVKTAPRGFSVEHPNIDLIRKKQFLISREFSDAEVMSDNFLGEVVQTFRNMRPFFDFMSEVLTTDENGVPLFE